MRTTKVLSITLPAPMLEEAQALAKKENRTMSELVREALRQYQREKRWEEINGFGRARAEAVGVRSEDDVVQVVHEHRREQRTKGKRRAS
jgi:metal-responsive CopG/Arc/MetJ family transcriptional regulator